MPAPCAQCCVNCKSYEPRIDTGSTDSFSSERSEGSQCCGRPGSFACGSGQRSLMMTRDDCLEADQRDPLADHRLQFVLPEGVLYLDGNSLGALPRATAGAVTRVIEQQWGA